MIYLVCRRKLKYRQSESFDLLTKITKNPHSYILLAKLNVEKEIGDLRNKDTIENIY